MAEMKTLAELAKAVDLPARTIRFYIARGLLEGPSKAGRRASYADAHVARIEEIKRLQADGHMLAEIAHLLGGSGKTEIESPTVWLQHVIGDDVMVWVRSDVAPWRMKQIRSALGEMTSLLVPEKSKTSRRNDK